MQIGVGVLTFNFSPCRQLAPVLQSAVKENGKAILVKINVDDNPIISQKYGIASLPTVYAFKDGEISGSFIGMRSPSDVNKFVQEHAKEE